ncbi:MAG TPA: tetratricopeptide repeat protein [Bryobacteraceae bacterium]|jgi:predicted CXXCH cytochrome family protein
MAAIPFAALLAIPLANAVDRGYVDSRVCAGCHQDIARSYAQTAMGRSMDRPGRDSRVEDYKNHNQLYHPASDRYYTLTERDGKVFQERHQTGFNSKQTNVVEKQADYVIGSGNHVRSYLHRTQEGKLVELPVSWYAENGGYWGMSPGYDTADQLDFRRTVSYECIFCHAAYPAESPGVNFADDHSLFGDTELKSIDCQRCHGPGKAHAEAPGRGAIVNPARLSRDRQLDVCMQCHLETTASFPITSIRRYGRAPFSYRPGEALGDFSVFFDRAPGADQDGRFEFVHAAYGLRKSACFRASQMTCTTCHNPHQVPQKAQAAELYSAVCRKCHATGHAAAVPGKASCLDCHMARRRPDDVVHAVVTDHYIRRRLPQGDLVAPRHEAHDIYRGEVGLYYPAEPTPENRLLAAVAQVRYSANLAIGIPHLQQEIEKQRPTRPEFYFELGVAYWKDGRKEDAVRWYDEALRHGEYLPARQALGEALTAAGRFTRAVQTLEPLAAKYPRDADILSSLGELYFQQGKLAAAGQIFERALNLNPELYKTRNWNGVVQGRAGNRVAAAEAFREAIRVRPDFDTAHVNLALLIAGDGDYGQAGYHLAKAIAVNPASVEAHHTYGLVLSRSGEWERASIELQEAVQLAPDLAEAHADLAEVLSLLGRSRESAEHYRRAFELKPQMRSRYPQGR